jgi:hypothetical protein
MVFINRCAVLYPMGCQSLDAMTYTLAKASPFSAVVVLLV